MLETLAPNTHLFSGNCLDLLSQLPPACIDAVVTDPPYGLEFMGKEWDGANGFRRALNLNDAERPNVFGRMSKKAPEYHAGPLFQRWCEQWASACLRVMKPGAHIAAFGSTRTYHRLACAIEDAGFEVFDQIQWLHGQGMPHGKNFSGAWEGWGTTLKPANEPIVLARKPLDGTFEQNIAKHGVGAMNIDACRVEIDTDIDDPRLGGKGTWSTDKMAKNVYEGGYAGIRTGSSELGRWPANVVHDGSIEVLAGFPDSKGQQGDVRGTEPSHTGDENTACYGEYERVPFAKREDKGSAARFFNAFREGEASADSRYSDVGSTNFAMLPGMRREPVEQARFYYCAKATKAERNGSKHPTIKPVALMRWLVKLVTPPNGMILDPFAGTGTTAHAAHLEGFRITLCEQDAKSQQDIRSRVSRM